MSSDAVEVATSACAAGNLPRSANRGETPRVGLLADYLEEGWPSMDLAAEMLASHLPAALDPGGEVALLRPDFKRHASGWMRGGTLGRAAWTFDRLVNRFVGYPSFLRGRGERFDLFHLADHSYSQLLHVLPAGRAVVTCHDLDSFLCLLEPEREPRSWPFRLMTRRILSGFRKAAHVCCDSAATRDAILRHGLLPKERLSVVPLGVDGLFFEDHREAFPPEVKAGEPTDGAVRLLHVGSTIPRKRIDDLLRIFAALRKDVPEATLWRIGGALTPAQQALARALGVAEAIVTFPFLSREEVAAVYQAADLVLLPSEAEGFGFPVLEALASGTPVIASDLPVLREVGGVVADYAPVGGTDAWVSLIRARFHQRRFHAGAWAAYREECRRPAAQFTWAETARKTAEIYREVMSRAARRN